METAFTEDDVYARGMADYFQSSGNNHDDRHPHGLTPRPCAQDWGARLAEFIREPTRAECWVLVHGWCLAGLVRLHSQPAQIAMATSSMKDQWRTKLSHHGW